MDVLGAWGPALAKAKTAADSATALAKLVKKRGTAETQTEHDKLEAGITDLRGKIEHMNQMLTTCGA
jgi:hypothetical protein